MSRRRSRPVSIVKAQNFPATRGATFTADQVAQMASALARTSNTVAPAQPLPRYDFNKMVPFGPGVPLSPAPINPVDPVTGRALPRQWEYPVAWNLPGFGERLIPWKVLRDAADLITLFRRCIEIRKAEVATLDWDVTISAKAIERAQRQEPGTAKKDIEKAMRERVDPHIGPLVDFWDMPDRRNGHDFIAWASKVLEEYFVLDALAIYPRLTNGGDLFGLEVLDGSTIKPLLDNDGFRPMPPLPAFQQILYGFPRGEFVADGEPDPEVPDQLLVRNAYPADRLVYKVHNVRSWTPYGFSAVEQALSDGELYARRMQWLKAEYTEGTMPQGWIETDPMQGEWSPAMLREFETDFNNWFAGNTAARQRHRILPPGMKAVESTDINEKFRPDYDLHLIKLVASHFDTTIAELGFTETGGLGSTGWHEGQADVQNRKATQPTLRRLQALCTQLMRTYLNAPPELEFRILGLESEDEDAADEIASRRVSSARMTLNEDRDRTGLPRYNFPEADMPMVATGRGVVFLEGASEQAPPGTLIGPAQAPPPAPGQPAPGQENPADAVPGGAPAKTPPAKPKAISKVDAGPVVDQLREDYPGKALDWLDDYDWTLRDVPLDEIDFSNSDSWQAAREPEKVNLFARKIAKGKMKPVLLVKPKGDDRYIVVDGHHRSMAARRLGVSVRAWTTDVASRKGPWDEMHGQQFHGHEDQTENTKADAASELAAYKRWAAKGKSNRTFRFQVLTKAQASEAGVDLSKADFGEAPRSGQPKSAALARVGEGSPGSGALGEPPRVGFDWDRLRRQFG